MQSPRCPSSRECGGCPWLDSGPDTARTIREERLRAALAQWLGPEVAERPIRWTARPKPEGYRRRIRLRVDDDGGIGFFNPSKYRECAALTPALRELLAEFLDQSRSHGEVLRVLRHLELREPDLDGYPGVHFVKREAARQLTSGERATLERWLEHYRFAVADAGAPIPSQRLALNGLWQFVPVSSFLQINAAVNECLVSDLVSEARARQLGTFCDLYAGSGNFALPLLAAGLDGCSAEIDAWACAAAERAAAAQSLAPREFVQRDAGEFARETAASRSYDLVVIDPPRAGVRQQLVAMAQLCRNSLVYCSCNVQSLARDLSQLVALGLELDHIGAYDMFEHTDHLETVVWMHRAH